MSNIQEQIHESVVEAADAPEDAPAKKPRKLRAPRAPKPVKTFTPVDCFSIEERLKHGSFIVDEACRLAACGRSSLYKDAREGRLTLTKIGGRTRVYGPELARYLAGRKGK